MSTLLADSCDRGLTRRNKSRFNRLADGIGSALGKHAEWRKPSLSKADPMAPAPVETRARESLLTPSQRARARSASQASQASIKTTASASTTNTMDKPSSLADVEMRYREESEMVRAAQEAVMHRPNFAIDAIGDSDGEEEEDGADDGVMDEVEAFLKAHGGDDDTAVKGAAKKEAEGESGLAVQRLGRHTGYPTNGGGGNLSGSELTTDLLKAEPMRPGQKPRQTSGDLVQL